MALYFFLLKKDKKQKANKDINKATTPPNFLGIDRRMA